MGSYKEHIFKGFSALLFGSKGTRSDRVNVALASTLRAIRGRTMAKCLSADIEKIAQDAKKAQRILLDERQAS